MRGIRPRFANSAPLTIFVLLAYKVSLLVEVLLDTSFPTDEYNDPIHGIAACRCGKVDDLLVRHAIDRSIDLHGNSVNDSWDENAGPSDNWNHRVVVFEHSLAP